MAYKGQMDSTVQLTDKECAVLGRAVAKVIKSILAREKNPIKRRLLQFKIPRDVQYFAAVLAEGHESSER